MLKKFSDDDDDIETIDVSLVRPKPLYHTNGEDGNDEEIREQEENDVPGLLNLHSVKKNVEADHDSYQVKLKISQRKGVFLATSHFSVEM